MFGECPAPTSQLWCILARRVTWHASWETAKNLDDAEALDRWGEGPRRRFLRRERRRLLQELYERFGVDPTAAQIHSLRQHFLVLPEAVWHTDLTRQLRRLQACQMATQSNVLDDDVFVETSILDDVGEAALEWEPLSPMLDLRDFDLPEFVLSFTSPSWSTLEVDDVLPFRL